VPVASDSADAAPPGYTPVPYKALLESERAAFRAGLGAAVVAVVDRLGARGS